MKKIYTLILCSIFCCSSNATLVIPANVAREVVMEKPLVYMKASSAGLAIINTTATVTSFDADLYSIVGSTVSSSSLSLTASGGNNDCAHLDDGIYKVELTAANIATPGTYVLKLEYAGCFTILSTLDVQDSNTYNMTHGKSPAADARIASVSAYVDSVEGTLSTISGYVDGIEGTQSSHTTALNNLATNLAYHAVKANADIAAVTATQASHTSLLNGISSDVGVTSSIAARIASATADIAVVGANVLSASDTLSQRVIANGSGIPASGMTQPVVSVSKIGGATWTMAIAGKSISAAEPQAWFEITRIGGDHARLFTHTDAGATNFTYFSSADYSGPAGYSGYSNWWEIQLTEYNLEYGKYLVSGKYYANGTLQGFQGILSQDETLTYTDTSAALAFYEDMTQMALDILTGDNIEIRAWQPVTEHFRDTPGVSSGDSVYCATGGQLYTEAKYTDADGTVHALVKIHDYNEVTGARSKSFIIPRSATADAAIKGVTLTPSF